MNKKRYVLVILLVFLVSGLVFSQFTGTGISIKKVVQKKSAKTTSTEFRTGDIIFQTTNSRQCKAVQLATHSQYSHCGLIFSDQKGVYVIEAIQPVCITPLDEWIARGKNDHYVVKRLKNADKVLSKDVELKMRKIANEYVGKNYDIYFGWSDESIYCSELVWKVYNRSINIEVGKLQKLKDFDLSSDVVKEELQERYGESVPMNEPVISPAGIMDSELLKTVFSN